MGWTSSREDQLERLREGLAELRQRAKDHPDALRRAQERWVVQAEALLAEIRDYADLVTDPDVDAAELIRDLQKKVAGFPSILEEEKAKRDVVIRAMEAEVTNLKNKRAELESQVKGLESECKKWRKKYDKLALAKGSTAYDQHISEDCIRRMKPEK